MDQAQTADSTPELMQNRKPLSRVFLAFTLLTLLCAGIFAPRVEQVRAAPVKQPLNSCPATIITQWTFTGDVVIPSTGVGIFANGAGLSPSIPPYTFFGGPANSAISFSGWANTPLDSTDFVEFDANTTGKNDIGINFQYRSTGTGPNTIELYYSIDGSTFIAFGAPQILTRDSAFHPLAFDLSSIIALNNNANTKFKIYAYGATGGNLRFDDVTITEICIPPTPTNTSTATNTSTSTNTPIFSLTPSLTPIPGEVFISEVAWAGTQASANDEWIELYNSRSTSIDITGWRLVTDSGSVDVILNGTIPANGTFLLERAHDVTVSDVSSNQIYFGDLADIGEVLRLKKPNGTVMDTANSDGGTWPAGGGSNLASMERMGIGLADTTLSWVTFNGTPVAHDANSNFVYGTPGVPNWGFTVTQTFTPTTSPTATLTRTPTPTLTPTPSASMSILINEVAWSGTLASSSDEWIELYNPGPVAINLAGWKLNASDGNPSINLNSIILPVGGYYILATSSTVFNNITVDQPFSGSLSNEGELLRLLDGSNTVVDTANSDSGAWPAGTAATGTPTYASMERRGKVTDGFFAWSTFAQNLSTPTPLMPRDRNNNLINGTPGKSNWGLTVTLTSTATSTPTRTPTGVKTSTLAPPVGRPIINEFLPRPGFDWNQDGKVNVFDEFIEVKNLGPVDINIGGWRLDDEENLGSDPFTLPSVTLKPGERIVFYGLETNILLSDGGDTVRLLNPSNKVYDSYTYKIAKFEDKSVCRLPDGNGSWYEDCVPTPMFTNSREGKVPSMPDGAAFQSPVCDLPDTLPEAFLIAECRGYGANLWRTMYWDADGWGSDVFVPENTSKWESFVE